MLSYGEKVVKIGPVHPEILDEICRTTTWACNSISIRIFSAETTRPTFTKIWHDLVALVALFNHAYTRRYLIPFLNARTTSEGGRFWRCQNSPNYVSFVIPKHVTCWKADRDWSSNCWDIQSNRLILPFGPKRCSCYPQNFWGYWTNCHQNCT